MKKHIPNVITLLNLLSGLIALVYAFDDNLPMAFFWVCMGIFLDFWDGFAARVLKVSSPLGVQLDSLADMVTSGVVPGVVMYQMLAHIQENNEMYNVTEDTFYMKLVPFIGFIITLGSCMRLAKFNIDTRQTDSFIGLPTPANALFILSIPMIMNHTEFDFVFNIFSNPYVLVGISLFSAFIMNAELPLFSLKTKNKNLSDNKLTFLFLGICALLLLFLQFEAIPIIIGFYIVLSVILNKTKKSA
ncbi:phosphatidylcholine/phosphatidylserine synthase [Flavobacterium sp. xlx-214]|uniref:CDP-alcohol phosphatidyltransferase family protein n=1 Tax=unclassified Flavobacterium TaxID=196869 RepID=UPI0013CF534D|nr:CDP-alcohol phosphatidyltransferase family protein [Flavobacterium sp. xlx-214]MBA5792419.1 CDP-alcohol phosphatidyltransferase family protein [Flavobacterium sp. xlx-221]